MTFSQQPIEEIITVHLSGQPKLSAGCTEFSSKTAANKCGRCVLYNKLGICYEAIDEYSTCATQRKTQ